MIVLGVIRLLVGLVAEVAIISTIGITAVVVGAVLATMPAPPDEPSAVP